MKLLQIVVASAVSFSLGPLALAQQAQEASPQPQDQSQGQAVEQGRSQPGQEQAGPGKEMEAKKQGAQQYSQETIRQVQKKLNEQGFSAGPVDGKWGPKTQSALKNFQQQKGIQATGQLDQKTLAELDVEAPAGGAAGASPSAGAGEQPGKEGAQPPAEKEAQQPGQSQSPSQ